MVCEKYREQIGDLIENKLDEQIAEQITLHLISCRNCESEFESLCNQREMYANLLFGIEPPCNLPAKFMAKLELEERKDLAVSQTCGFNEQIWKLFAFLRLNPAMTGIILFVIGFGFFSFAGDQEIAQNNQPATEIVENPKLILSRIKEVEVKKVAPLTASAKPQKAEIVELKKEVVKENPQLISAKQTEVKKSVPRSKIAAKVDESNAEEQNRFAQIQGLEIDAAQQIEKVEILFRSFRNACSTEETGQYDFDYEKQQARKLLQNNVALKQRAESYGTLLTEEMLNKVEPYLLDIANLDSNPSAEQVSEIKDRFQSQQIIASLQGF